MNNVWIAECGTNPNSGGALGCGLFAVASNRSDFAGTFSVNISGGNIYQCGGHGIYTVGGAGPTPIGRWCVTGVSIQGCGVGGNTSTFGWGMYADAVAEVDFASNFVFSNGRFTGSGGVHINATHGCCMSNLISSNVGTGLDVSSGVLSAAGASPLNKVV
jgi:hypothetical protein